MELTEADYLDMLVALLPPGPAWSSAEDDRLRSLLSGWAVSLARAEQRLRGLIEEADPRTTSMLLADWERVAGLPDSCELAIGGEQTVVQRRAALLSRLVSVGGISRAYYVSVIEALGYTATITEFRSQTVEFDVEAAMHDDDWEATWQVDLPAASAIEMTAADDVETPLMAYGNAIAECVLKRLNRAGATLLFNYTS